MLACRPGLRGADTRILCQRKVLERLCTGEVSPEQAIASGDLKITGNREVISKLFGLFDRFTLMFDVVAPTP